MFNITNAVCLGVNKTDCWSRSGTLYLIDIVCYGPVSAKGQMDKTYTGSSEHYSRNTEEHQQTEQ